MRRYVSYLLLALAVAGGCAIQAGCVVYPARGPGYVPGHYAPNGYWVGGHYR